MNIKNIEKYKSFFTFAALMVHKKASKKQPFCALYV